MKSVVCIGACAVAAGASAAVASALAPPAPSLRLVAEAPLVVRGVDFRASEKISVTAQTLLGPRRIVVRASGTGTFRASLRLYTQPCGRAFTVRAVGDRGSTAMLRLRSEPCVPPPRD